LLSLLITAGPRSRPSLVDPDSTHRCPQTSASWLNLVERWFVELTEKQIRRGVHRSTRQTD
jgi:hypothetical protein